MKAKLISFRPTPDMRERLLRLSKATGHSLTYHVAKAIEGHLPELERRYAKELHELAHYPERTGGVYVEERPPAKKNRAK